MNNLQSYRRIMSRQGLFVWGQEYQPGILANRVEGPKCSRLSQLWSAKLGRTVHLLSSGEKLFAQLALYHPDLFELHEQRMLSPSTAAHPLHGHPRARGMQLRSVLGTVEFAIAKGGTHASVNTVVDGVVIPRAYPYLGDLLLYMQSVDGLPYCVNWTIKAQVGDFSEKRRTKIKSLESRKKDQEKAAYRQLLEQEHYSAAGIRTVQLVPSEIDDEVRFNLDFLYSWLGSVSTLDAVLMDDFDGEVRNAVSMGAPLSGLVIRYSSRWGGREHFLARIYQSIWKRELQVDLFSPLLIDKPFSTKTRDVLEIYGHLFSERV